VCAAGQRFHWKITCCCLFYGGHHVCREKCWVWSAGKVPQVIPRDWPIEANLMAKAAESLLFCTFPRKQPPSLTPYSIVSTNNPPRSAFSLAPPSGLPCPSSIDQVYYCPEPPSLGLAEPDGLASSLPIIRMSTVVVSAIGSRPTILGNTLLAARPPHHQRDCCSTQPARLR